MPGLPGHFRISAISNTSTGEARQVAIDVNKTTGVVTQAVVVPLAGTVISAGQTYVNTAGQTVAVPVGQLAVVNPSGSTYVQAPTTAVAPAAINISIPTDYARAGESIIAAKSITDKLAETKEETDLVEPVLSNPLSNYFNPLRSWSMPVSTGSCPAGSFSWNGNSYSFNIMCTLFESYLTMIQGGMNVIYSLAALFIVLGA